MTRFQKAEEQARRAGGHVRSFLQSCHAAVLRFRSAVRPPTSPRWVHFTALTAAIPLVTLDFAGGYYYYILFARLIDARLEGARQRLLLRVFARPLELRRGQAMTDRQLPPSNPRSVPSRNGTAPSLCVAQALNREKDEEHETSSRTNRICGLRELRAFVVL